MINYLEEALISIGKGELIPLRQGTVSNCFEFMKPSLLEYLPNKSLKMKFPVQKVYLNPAKCMQGGFISAAFDNAFGMLCFLATEKRAVSLDLNTNFHKPIFENDDLIITVCLKYVGKTLINMYAEAFNICGDLIATADSKMMFIK